MKLWENFKLRAWQLGGIEGRLCLDRAVLDKFLAAPLDMAPDFIPPPHFELRGGRGKDHPRYGRFAYAMARHYRPEYIVEVGTFAGGTAVGWARALVENQKGKLICIDRDVYSRGTFPQVTQQNLDRVGITTAQYELLSGDSRERLPQLAEQLPGQVDLYLVDGDHTYEGALSDITGGLSMMRPGGFVLVHDVDPGRRMDEQTPEHPHPVLEAFQDVVSQHGYQWCILKFIRKHLGIIRVAPAAH
jgi:predicted O-methyltransferase YrrM